MSRHRDDTDRHPGIGPPDRVEETHITEDVYDEHPVLVRTNTGELYDVVVWKRTEYASTPDDPQVELRGYPLHAKSQKRRRNYPEYVPGSAGVGWNGVTVVEDERKAS